MSEIFKCVEKLLNNNGVCVYVEGLQFSHPGDDMRCVRIEKEILTLDFSEHDKAFEDKIADLESELEVKDNLLKIKNGLCGNDEMKDKEPIEIAMDIIKSRNIDDLEQIAQHIQVYCRHTRSRRDDTIAF